MSAPMKTVYFVSAELSTRTLAENICRTADMISDLERMRIPYARVDGVFEGQPEVSVMLENKSVALQLMVMCQQKCILELDQSDRPYAGTAGMATLIMADQSRVPLGRMQLTSHRPAGKDYSYLPHLKMYLHSF